MYPGIKVDREFAYAVSTKSRKELAKWFKERKVEMADNAACLNAKEK